MTDSNLRQDRMNHPDPENGRLDHELDTALAKYATVEPRAGLEDRILAALRAEREHASVPAWWRWPALSVTVAVVIVAAGSLVWKLGMPTPDDTHRAPTTAEGDTQTGMRTASNDLGSPAHPAAPATTKKPARRTVRHPQAVVASAPKLDQFPSPKPLSEQEAILARYITNDPAHAALIAQARTEELRRDSAEEMGETASADNESSDSRNK
jgi:hypothetical protein